MRLRTANVDVGLRVVGQIPEQLAPVVRLPVEGLFEEHLVERAERVVLKQT
jgi:hypothetical protein